MGDDTSTDAPSLILIRYPNLSGALVLVTATPGTRNRMNHGWSCGGCLASDTNYSLPELREAANSHAASCRALPQPTPATV